MNYRKIYISIIVKAKNRELDKNEYYEKHHVLPRSLFPNWIKRKENIVFLTAREHYFCHQLLTKIYPCKKMYFALWQMSMKIYNKKQYNFNISSREYERNKKMIWSLSKKPLEIFIEEGKQKYNNFFDYSKVNYINNKTKVEIICPKHGSFWVTPKIHLKSNSKGGCKKCAGLEKYTTETFIEKAKKIHGNKYDYSLVNYINSQTKIKIICPEHGVFEIRPARFLCDRSCPNCGLKNKGNNISKAKNGIDKNEFWINNKFIQKVVNESELKYYLNNGWFLGKIIRRKNGSN